MKPTLTLLAALLALPAARAADDAALRRCRVIADDKARLACFDALVPMPSRGVSAPAPEPVGMPMPSPAAPPLAMKAEAPAPAPAPAPAADPRFGLDKPAAQPEAVTTTYPGTFSGWAPRQRLKLANGQVWQVADDTDGVYDLRDPKVTIRRTLFGSYVMEIEGAKRTLRVRRVE